MRILSIGTDPHIFDAASESARRMAGYGELAERYDVIARARPGQHDVDLSPRVRVYAASAAHPALFPLAAFIAARRARAGGPWDVVTAQDPFETGLVSWVVARWSGAGLHLQIHGDYYGSLPWRRERVGNRLRYLLAFFLARRADGFRVVSERIKQSLTSIGVPPDRIIVSPIASRASARADGAIASERTERAEPRILFVGRLEPEKNPLLLLRAFTAVVARLPHARLRFVGAGSEERRMREYLRIRGLEAAVSFGPWTSLLGEEYAAASVLAVPSNHEGWGRVVVEAAAAGVPVVMTDVGCAGEFVRDGESGWVVPVGDAERLSNALTDVLTHPEEGARRAKALGKAPRPTAAARAATLRASWERASKRDTLHAASAMWKLIGIGALARTALFALFWVRFGTGGEWGWFVLGSDDVEYLRLGRNLWHGIFSMSAGTPLAPDSSRTILFPLFLSLGRFLPGAALIAAGLACSLVGLALWYRFARRVFDERLAWWSTLLFAVDPLTLFWLNQFTTEALFSIFWFSGLIMLSKLFDTPRPGTALLAGVLLGLAMLTRPIILLYPVIILFLLAMRHARRSWRKAAIAGAMFIMGIVLMVGPWAYRNYRTFGVLTVSSAGAGIWYGENAFTYLVWKHGINRDQAGVILRRDLPNRPLRMPEDDAAKMRVVGKLFRADPIGFSSVIALSAVPFFFGDGYASLFQTFAPGIQPPAVRWEGSLGTYLAEYLRDIGKSGPYAAVFLIGKILSVAIVTLALVGATAAYRDRSRRFAAVWLVLTMLYFALVSSTVAYSRYRYPVQPMLFLFAVAGLVKVVGAISAREREKILNL